MFRYENLELALLGEPQIVFDRLASPREIEELECLSEYILVDSQLAAIGLSSLHDRRDCMETRFESRAMRLVVQGHTTSGLEHLNFQHGEIMIEGLTTFALKYWKVNETIRDFPFRFSHHH